MGTLRPQREIEGILQENYAKYAFNKSNRIALAVYRIPYIQSK